MFNLKDFGLDQLELTKVEKARVESVFREGTRFDEWGASLDTILSMSRFGKFLFEKYFRVSIKGIEKIPDGPVLFVANHGGQIPIDGMMVVYSLLTQTEKPRLLRSMVERWVPSLPFVGSFLLKSGQIVGDQRNCLQLLQKGHSVLVFPEGVHGSGKTIDKRYQLQNFPLGFYRLAQEAKVSIVPIAIVGSEECYPSVFNAKRFAKIVNAPYVPITPTFPWLGPLGLIPLPAKISIKFLEPHPIKVPFEATDAEIKVEVEKIRKEMQNALNLGLKQRGDHIFTGDAFKD